MPKVTLSSTARHAFSPDTRERGGKLLRYRRVTIDGVQDGWVGATVRGGTDAFSVIVGVRPSRLLVDCTCDTFAREHPCIHMWSVLLALDRTGAFVPDAREAFVEPLHATATRWDPAAQLDALHRARRERRRPTRSIPSAGRGGA
ncbi:MAG: hypothetical protein KC657_27445 [Myxococcales bacterium]|nr:hypothetical protein [Myxococcales bacterium]